MNLAVLDEINVTEKTVSSEVCIRVNFFLLDAAWYHDFGGYFDFWGGPHAESDANDEL